MRTPQRLVVAVTDWWWAIWRWVDAVLGPPLRGGPGVRVADADTAPGTSGAPASDTAAPVVLLPGIYERPRFLRELVAALRAAGHDVHTVDRLGFNRRTLAASRRIVLDLLAERDLRGVVLVGHSKGGLIGKRVMLASERVIGMVTVCTPFTGSRLMRRWLARTDLGLFDPTHVDLVALSAERSVNARIVSLATRWDEMIPEGSHLDGGLNVTLDAVGHFRPLADPRVLGVVCDHVGRLGRQPQEQAVRIIAIAIVAANGVIGDGEKQPFEFAEDWARYKAVTQGHPMIMGRGTHDAIGRWLPGRTTIVVTRRPELVTLPTDGRATGYAASSVEEALALARTLDDTIYVAGGGQVYREAWPVLTDLDLTEVHADAEGSVTFPDVDPAQWREVRREPREEFDFVGYERVAPTD